MYLFMHKLKRVKNMFKRCIAVYICIFAVLCGICARLVYIVTSPHYTATLTHNTISVEISQNRGTVFDCNGKKLTNNGYTYTALVTPYDINNEDIAPYLNDFQKEQLREGYPVAVTVDTSFNSDTLSVVRAYDRYSAIAAHIIGYTDAEGNGVCGVESGYNDILNGETISAAFYKDGNGSVLHGIKPQIINNEPASGIMLTIDKKIQQIIEQVAEKELSLGAVVVIENGSGKIRGMCSVPAFSQKNIETALDDENSPFLNRALCSYSPGSVFKIVTAAAALESDVEFTFECTGSVKVGDRDFHCVSEHGNVDLCSALSQSCNCYFIKLALLLGADTVYSMAKNLGFLQEDKLCEGIVADEGGLTGLSVLNNSKGALSLFSFGQGDVEVTPVQIASMLQCITNGGKQYKPTLIEGITDNEGSITEAAKQMAPTFVLSESTANTLCEYLMSAVNNGTGKSAQTLSGDAGGKTATVQTGRYSDDGTELDNTWFAGFFANKKYSVVIFNESDEFSAKSCAPIFAQIANRICEMK